MPEKTQHDEPGQSPEQKRLNELRHHFAETARFEKDVAAGQKIHDRLPEEKKKIAEYDRINASGRPLTASELAGEKKLDAQILAQNAQVTHLKTELNQIDGPGNLDKWKHDLAARLKQDEKLKPELTELENKTRGKYGWTMPEPGNEAKDRALHDGIVQAANGKEFKYPADGPKLTALEDETLKRGVLAHLPADKQEQYKAKMGLDGPTSNDLKRDVPGLEGHDLRDATNRMQLATLHAKEGKNDVNRFAPGKDGKGLTQEQCDKLNAMIDQNVKEHMHAPPIQAVSHATNEAPGHSGSPQKDNPATVTVDGVPKNGAFRLSGTMTGVTHDAETGRTTVSFEDQRHNPRTLSYKDPIGKDEHGQDVRHPIHGVTDEYGHLMSKSGPHPNGLPPNRMEVVVNEKGQGYGAVTFDPGRKDLGTPTQHHDLSHQRSVSVGGR